jgi:hypothetical protein
MAELSQYLEQFSEDVPVWLDRFQPGDALDRVRFLSSRVVYYPGSGKDGHPVKLFGSAHAAHCFVYADSGEPLDALEAELASPTYRFLGYHRLERIHLFQQSLTPRPRIQHFEAADASSVEHSFTEVTPLGFLEILERDPGRDDAHGARRLAVMFLREDGVATYDVLFCQSNDTPAPFAVVVVDHRLGGNFDRFGNDDRFGRGGSLGRIAGRCRVFPQWLLVDANTDSWKGYTRVPGVDGESGGSHRELRFLYERT